MKHYRRKSPAGDLTGRALYRVLPQILFRYRTNLLALCPAGLNVWKSTTSISLSVCCISAADILHPSISCHVNNRWTFNLHDQFEKRVVKCSKRSEAPWKEPRVRSLEKDKWQFILLCFSFFLYRDYLFLLCWLVNFVFDFTNIRTWISLGAWIFFPEIFCPCENSCTWNKVLSHLFNWVSECLNLLQSGRFSWKDEM